MSDFLQRFKPAVPRRVLAPLAAFVWAAVGVVLLIRSGIWLFQQSTGAAIVALALGSLMAGLMIPRMFMRLVGKNLTRLAACPERACLFSVLAWRSWGIALVMSIAGIALRHSSVPRIYLIVPYFGMGLCLLAGAIRYGQALKSRSN